MYKFWLKAILIPPNWHKLCYSSSKTYHHGVCMWGCSKFLPISIWPLNCLDQFTMENTFEMYLHGGESHGFGTGLGRSCSHLTKWVIGKWLAKSLARSISYYVMKKCLYNSPLLASLSWGTSIGIPPSVPRSMSFF
jgi:hypothetical protein